MEIVRGINWGTYYFFNFQANKLPWLRPVMEVFDFLGGYLVLGLIVLLTVMLLLGKKQTRMALAVVFFTLAGVGLVETVRFLLHSPRPPANAMRLDEMYRSFPAVSVFLAFLVLLNLALAMEYVVSTTRLCVVVYVGLVLLALLITVSQLFLRTHWLSDVLAGMTGGIGLALLCRAQKVGGNPRVNPS